MFLNKENGIRIATKIVLITAKKSQYIFVNVRSQVRGVYMGMHFYLGPGAHPASYKMGNESLP